MENYKLDPIPFNSGSFGAVFKARIPNGPELCMKKSHDDFDESQKKKLETESSILKCLSHENIIKFIDSFWYKNNFWIVMEFADGGNLKQKLDELEKLGKSFTEKEILDIMKQILQGLQYLHSKNIVHRDLKAENILFFKNGQLKIADFGLSKIIDKSIVSFHTFAGSLQYMSPEIYQNDRWGKPSDIWSLGIISYLLATKNLPFDAETQSTVTHKVLNCDPDSIRILYSRQFKLIIYSMLQKDHNTRPSATELLRSVDQLLGTQTSPQTQNQPSQIHQTIPQTLFQTQNQPSQIHQIISQTQNQPAQTHQIISQTSFPPQNQLSQIRQTNLALPSDQLYHLIPPATQFPLLNSPLNEQSHLIPPAPQFSLLNYPSNEQSHLILPAPPFNEQFHLIPPLNQ